MENIKKQNLTETASVYAHQIHSVKIMTVCQASPFILTLKTWSSGPGQRQRALPQSLVIRSIGVMEYWSIEKIISGCEVFHKPSLYNVSIRDQIVLPTLQHSITPILHKPFKFKETKSPLGITKAGSFGPGFLLPLSLPMPCSEMKAGLDKE